MVKDVDGRKISRETLEAYRFRAIELRKKKWKVNEIAESFGLHRSSISRWFTQHKRGGEEALKTKKAKGARPKLEKKEVEKIISCIRKPATTFGFESPLWDCKKIQQLIKKECKTQIHVSNVWRMLISWNFTPQIPTKNALEENEEEVKKWLEKEWPKIKAHARRWRAIIYFLDECGVSLIPVMGKTWAPKGETPVIKVTGHKGGICVTSAVSPVGRMVFRIEKEKVSGLVHIEFLKQMIKNHPQRKIIVIEDKAPAHIAGIVKGFVKENEKKFAMYFLPSYAPKLNPDEQTWKYLKQHKLKAHQAQNKEELKKLIFAKMKSIQKTPTTIRSFFYEAGVT